MPTAVQLNEFPYLLNAATLTVYVYLALTVNTNFNSKEVAVHSFLLYNGAKYRIVKFVSGHARLHRGIPEAPPVGPPGAPPQEPSRPGGRLSLIHI